MIPCGASGAGAPTILTGQEKSEVAAQYLLILGACRAVLQAAPVTPGQCDVEDVEHLLISSLVQLVSTIAAVLPGGVEEMAYYFEQSNCTR